MSTRQLGKAIRFVLATPLFLLVPGLALLFSKMWATAVLTVFLSGTCIYLATLSSKPLALLYLLLATSIHLAALSAILALKGEVSERG